MRFIITKSGRNTFKLYDTFLFGIDTMVIGCARQASIDKARKNYYIRLYDFYDNEGESCSYSTKIKLNTVEEFTTLEEVRKKYSISKEPITAYNEKGYVDGIDVYRLEGK